MLMFSSTVLLLWKGNWAAIVLQLTCFPYQLMGIMMVPQFRFESTPWLQQHFLFFIIKSKRNHTHPLLEYTPTSGIMGIMMVPQFRFESTPWLQQHFLFFIIKSKRNHTHPLLESCQKQLRQFYQEPSRHFGMASVLGMGANEFVQLMGLDREKQGTPQAFQSN